MVPVWLRRLTFGAGLLASAVFLASIARPDACADVWTLEHRVSGCCALSAHDRVHPPGRDCCAAGAVDDRADGAFATGLSVPPAALAAVVALDVMAPPALRRPAPDASIPERPPDRAHRTVVLLI